MRPPSNRNAATSAPPSTRQSVRRTVPNAPSPGIVAAAIKNEHYDTENEYLEALGDALRVEYETIVTHGFLLQLDAPDLAMERHISYQDKPLWRFLGFVDRVVATINAALVNVPRDQVRLHVCWGNYEGPHDCDVPLEDIMPILRRPMSAALCCRSPTRATHTNTLLEISAATVRSWSPA